MFPNRNQARLFLPYFPLSLQPHHQACTGRLLPVLTRSCPSFSRLDFNLSLPPRFSLNMHPLPCLAFLPDGALLSPPSPSTSLSPLFFLVFLPPFNPYILPSPLPTSSYLTQPSSFSLLSLHPLLPSLSPFPKPAVTPLLSSPYLIL